MSEKKHIDRLFQEKFKDFESQPPASVWEGIRSELTTPGKKDRKVIPIWWRVAGVAALLALLFTAITFWGPDANTTDFVDTDTNQIEESSSPNDALINPELNNTVESQDAIVSDNNQTKDSKTSNDALLADDPIESQIDNQIKSANAVVNANKSAKQNKTQNKSVANKTAADALIKTNTNDLIKDAAITTAAVVSGDNQTKTTQGTSGVDTQVNQDKDSYKNTNEALVNKDAINNTLKDNTSDAVGIVINESVKDDTTNATNNSSNKTEGVINETEEGKVDINEYIANKQEQEAIAQEEILLKKQESDGKRWSLAPQVAPVFYGSLTDGSSIGAEFADNNKSSEANLSYGLQVSYNVNDRFSIRSGVNKVNLSYNTNDIEFAVTPGDVALSGTKFVNGNVSYTVGDKGTLQDRFAAAVPAVEDAVPATIDAFQGQLNQRLEYWEVPVEMSYALINSRFRLNLVGGFSSLILQDNQLVATSGDREASLGSSENLNAFSFTTNVGLGFNYNITDQFRISMEPMFKYQLNPYSDASVDFKPYYMGVYTGLSFRF